MYLHVSIDTFIRSLENARKFAEAHNRGNEAGIIAKIIRDVESLRDLPAEVFAGAEPIIAAPPVSEGGPSWLSDEPA